ncbi:MFS general substrate transporter [Lentinula lateritia]|uniref:MFS general substrate transporter n=1 Tax=Lentinula aff. lateritia TaxID=2804960 RepID=A0ACC1TKC7_9AGAR|nr:MFS general substrate transporter [Lentinula aff. lateritia]KAJ3847008.1 MFS general substrate transporter [Lentinula lateritia]
MHPPVMDQKEKTTSADKALNEQHVSPTGQLPSFPEGGLQAWSTVLGAFLFQFTAFGFVNSFGVFNDFYVREYLSNETSSDIGWIGSAQLAIVLAMGIMTGRLFDQGFFHHLVIAGSVLFVFSVFMLSITHEHQYYQVFLSHGLGVGFLPSLGIASHYFQTKRPLVMAIISAGAPLGAVIHPIMLNKLIHGSLGFHNAVRANAGMDAGLLIISNLLVRTRLPPRSNSGLIPVREFFKDLPYVASLAGGFLVLTSLFYPIFFIQLDGITHGLDPNFAFYSVSILQATNFWGRIIPLLFVPKIGHMNVLIVFTMCSMILTFSMIAVTTVGGTIAFSVLYGFCSGAAIALVPPLFATFARNFGEVGARMGVGIFLGGVGGLIGLPIDGALLTSQFLWWRPAVFSGSILVAASICFLTSRMGVAKAKGTGKV